MFESDASDATGLLPRLPAGAVDCPSLSDSGLVDVVAEAERLIAQLHAVQLDALAELTTRPYYAEPVELAPAEFAQPFQRSAAEAAAACRWSRMMAEHRTLLGEQLRDKLPATLAALRAGRIDLNRARAVAEATEGLSAESAAAVEERVLTRAPEQTTTQLRAALRRAVLAIDPAAAQRRHDQAVADRRVDVRELPDGIAELSAPMRADKAEAVYARLTAIARDALENYRAANPHSADPNTSRHAEPSLDSLRVDALLWLVLGDPMPGVTSSPALDPAPASPGQPGTTPPSDQSILNGAATASGCTAMQPTASPGQADAVSDLPTAREAQRFGAGCAHCGCARPRPLLNLHMPLGTALGLSEEPAELSGYGPIPADLARELAADATWRRIFTDPVSGNTIAAESASYKPPASMAALVRARDGTCRFPGCQQPATRTDIDHRIPWPHGSTCPCNLCCLCRFHHLLKTHYGWRYTQDPTTGVVTWTSPSGHKYPTLPARIPDGAKRNVDERPESPDVPQSS